LIHFPKDNFFGLIFLYFFLFLLFLCDCEKTGSQLHNCLLLFLCVVSDLAFHLSQLKKKLKHVDFYQIEKRNRKKKKKSSRTNRPDRSGHRFLPVLRRFTRFLPVLMLSGSVPWSDWILVRFPV
jgi:hypothetical protein